MLDGVLSEVFLFLRGFFLLIIYTYVCACASESLTNQHNSYIGKML